ncbi:MAG: hypothetical protein AAF703_06060 [Cyanobacteria bacterium P01_D01_bin.105]
MKVLLVGLTIVAGAVGAGLGYAGIKTTFLPSRGGTGAALESVEADSQVNNGGRFPDGYVSGNATYEGSVEAWSNPSREPFAEAASAVDDGNSMTVSSADLNEMVSEAIANRPDTAPILDAAQNITTAIKNDRIESGTRINLSDLPIEVLPAEGQQAVAQLTQTFPFLANRDVYVGVEGAPSIVDGDLSLEDTYIRLGQLRLPVAQVANQLGLSQDDVEQQISALLNLQDIRLSDVRVEDNQLVIVGQ